MIAKIQPTSFKLQSTLSRMQRILDVADQYFSFFPQQDDQGKCQRDGDQDPEPQYKHSGGIPWNLKSMHVIEFPRGRTQDLFAAVPG